MTLSGDELAAPPAPARASHLFTAPLACGAVGIGLPARRALPAHAPGSRVLDAAAALAAAEPWLATAEEWLGCGLLPSLGSPHAFDQHAVLTDPASGSQLHLPIAALAALKAPLPPALATWVWRPLVCELLLDAMPLTESDLCDLQPGALLLLPAAFASPWSARLRPLASAAGQGADTFGATLIEQRGRLCLAAAAALVPSPPEHHATVRFAQTVEARVPQLLGWGDATPGIEAPLLLSNGVLVLHSAAPRPRAIAAGQLFPVGNGFGMRIERLLDEAPSHDISRQLPIDIEL